MKTMLAARMHEVGSPMLIEELPLPKPGPIDVRVAVKACNIVPNLANILRNWTTWFPQNPLPELPAIFGLDPAGVIDAVGSQVHDFKPGDRVYVNPGRYCGSCRACRRGDLINCRSYAFAGYFGFTERSKAVLREYPYGGLAEFMIAPRYSPVRLLDNVSFAEGARFGYLGTVYSAMRKVGAGPGSTMLVNGITGTLGIGGALFGIAMGVTRILGTARNRDLLQRVKALAPERIEVFSLQDGTIDGWVRKITDDEGVDIYLDCLGPGAPHETMLQGLRALARGGKAVNIGGMAGTLPFDVHTMMDQQQQFIGSAWFTAAEGDDMAAMARAGTLDLSVFEHIRSPLRNVNEAITGVAGRNGGFSNFVIEP
ncbi:MAG TPA: alcohol dehydrogenase catalytic domain-containing protein [Patescibacteria group bacterium]|nr:alcohol dehydrogenase catalytic domain-containing protein [Patescibacteria group bacterium]